jgi:hypothetical protein
MEEWLSRLGEDLIGRVSGPMKLRLILQPLMATLLAVRDGLKDARQGRPPWFWAVFTTASHRRDLVRDGWKSVGKVFLLAVVLDTVYQFIELRWFYPFESILVACLLALVPYILIRGPANRVWRGRR